MEPYVVPKHVTVLCATTDGARQYGVYLLIRVIYNIRQLHTRLTSCITHSFEDLILDLL